MAQKALEWLKGMLEWNYGDPEMLEISWENLDDLIERAKQKEEKEQSLIWNKDAPKENGDYICRMSNAYIKLCHYEDGLWYDMWESDIDGEVKEWMYIPYNK